MRAKTPDATLHRTGAAATTYLRELVETTGLTQADAARAVGVDARTMRRYLALTPAARLDAPYTVQFALEQLAGARR